MCTLPVDGTNTHTNTHTHTSPRGTHMYELSVDGTNTRTNTHTHHQRGTHMYALECELRLLPSMTKSFFSGKCKEDACAGLVGQLGTDFSVGSARRLPAVQGWVES